MLRFAGRVKVLTADTGMRVRARSEGLDVLFVPREWRRWTDDEVRQISVGSCVNRPAGFISTLPGEFRLRGCLPVRLIVGNRIDDQTLRTTRVRLRKNLMRAGFAASSAGSRSSA